jgi:phosphoribosylformylglycinamidine synthase
MTEWTRGEFVRTSIRTEYVTACHDISDGGFAVALAEMCMASDKGADVAIECTHIHAALFGEDQSRYVVSVQPDYADMFAANAESAGVSFQRLGKIGGDMLTIGDVITISVKSMRAAHENWLPHYMAADNGKEA